MKAKAFYEMTNDELKVKLGALKQEALKLRFEHAGGRLENANQLSFIKKDIARAKTVLRQRELNISAEPVAVVAKGRTKKAK